MEACHLCCACRHQQHHMEFPRQLVRASATVKAHIIFSRHGFFRQSYKKKSFARTAVSFGASVSLEFTLRPPCRQLLARRPRGLPGQLRGGGGVPGGAGGRPRAGRRPAGCLPQRPRHAALPAAMEPPRLLLPALPGAAAAHAQGPRQPGSPFVFFIPVSVSGFTSKKGPSRYSLIGAIISNATKIFRDLQLLRLGVHNPRQRVVDPQRSWQNDCQLRHA